MYDEVFGELNYEYGWNGTISLNWCDTEIDVDIVINGEEDEEIEPVQYDSYKMFKKDLINIQENLLEKILLYYKNLREELGYDDDSNEDYPEIVDINELKNKIGLDTIIIPNDGIYDGRCIALAFHCSWDDENGLGVILVNEQISEIGYQDIVF